MFTIAVCDDDLPFARALTHKLCQLCAYHVPDRIDCHVVPKFGSAAEVLQYLSKSSIDVLFLDINMPQINGFQLARMLNEKYPNTILIFVSAQDHLVYESFAFSPFCFLRKNHLTKELPITLHKVIEKYIINGEAITFQTTEGEILLPVKDILYFESEKNYYTVHCVSGVVYRCRGTMASVEEATQKYDFFRIHPAYLINEAHIAHIDDTRGTVQMKDGSVFCISHRKVSDFRDRYMEFIRRNFPHSM